jgi:peptidoglycan/xylan/chitin deacetylase (PgdA/CDA1 family)
VVKHARGAGNPLCFDDAYDSAYDIAFAHMQAHNIRGTVGCWTNQVGAGGYCSWAELREMNAAGWAIANHSCDDVDFTTLTQAEIEARLVEAAADLAAAGLSRCAKYVIYPAGGCNATSDLALAAQGMVCGRTTSPHTTRPLVLPHHNLYRLESTSVSNSVSLATVQGYVDTAITEKAILPLHFHDIDGGTGWTSADFNDPDRLHRQQSRPDLPHHDRRAGETEHPFYPRPGGSCA